MGTDVLGKLLKGWILVYRKHLHSFEIVKVLYLAF